MVSILVLQILLCVIGLGGTVGKIDFLQKSDASLEAALPTLVNNVRVYFLSTGDIESMPFIEALRQLSFSVGMSIAYFSFKLTV
ncbi:hypothetical protein Lalb_Chr06g0166691 [Lupinus albus]|uniref:Uncharacterized protein n=1 Tax=Lupinus albus TaxID=3870 RepID=A0A6A4QE73_LUPAL|nr:hypothetical protein Lalb_Chr06g0166691 [Lupinus albus]